MQIKNKHLSRPTPYLRFIALAITSLCTLPALGLSPVPTPIEPPSERRVPPRETVTPRPPWIGMVVQQAEKSIELETLQVEVTHEAGLLRTRVHMSFFNPNNRVLEGELQFPLTPDQTVTGFALDINGQMRRAVPVDKPRAQEVFEAITRRQVDPGLLQATLGNNYKLRVYPLPAQGTRTVMLQIDERVGSNFSIPLGYAPYAKNFKLNLRLSGLAQAPTITDANPLNLRFATDANNKNSFSASMQGQQVKLPPSLNLRTQRETRSLYSTQAFGDQQYFLLTVPQPKQAAPIARAPLSRITVVWDASASGQQRAIDKELLLLEAYFARNKNLDVQLVLVADQASAPQRFEVRNGQWSGLRKALESVIYDGASNLASVTPDGTTQEVLWFTDGLSNYGRGWEQQFNTPNNAAVIAVSSGLSVNAAALNNLAQNTGGRWINLQPVANNQVAKTVNAQLDAAPLPQLRTQGAADVVMRQTADSVIIAGRFTDNTANIMLTGPAWNNQQHELRAGQNPSQLASTQWAQLQLDKLSASPQLHTAQIRRLGQQFGLVTSQTSLLVLELAQDYVRYDIPAPPELAQEVSQLRTRSMQAKQQSEQQRIAQLVARFKQRNNWWDKEFPKGDIPAPPKEEEASVVNQTRRPAPAGAAVDRRTQSVDLARAPTTPPPVAAARVAPPPPPPAAAAPVMRAEPLAESAAPSAFMRARKESAKVDSDNSASIQLQASRQDAPYLKRLNGAAAQDWYGIYLDERKDYSRSVSFYLDVAQFFFDKKQNAVALKVLSNLAEMDLENRQVLRLLAYRLLQAEQVALAIPLLERVVLLAPNEPQSHRDLGLAFARNNQPQRAVKKLYEVVTGQWDGRFVDVDLIALNELNNVIEQAKRNKVELDTRSIDSRLIRHLPVDLRVVLAWDADNTDVDLHVTDPNGQTVFYGQPMSYQGGSITRDATGGYGPEEFLLRKAKPGVYKVEAVFYGHRQQVLTSSTGLMLHLSSNYGSAKQKDQYSTVQVKTQSQEKVLIGTFTVPAQ